MELEGAGYLYNLSLLGIGFAVVSALVTLLRQILGGRLAAADVDFIASYVSFGFVLAIAAILPPLIVMLPLPDDLMWLISSLTAAVLVTVNLVAVILRRRRSSSASLSPAALIGHGLQGAAAVMLLINGLVVSVQGMGLYAGALTLGLANMMWAFARSLSSLRQLGDDLAPVADPEAAEGAD